MSQTKTTSAASASKGKPRSSDPSPLRTDHAEAFQVIPKRAGFRRAGYAFPQEGLILTREQLSDTQLQQLLTEPMLVVIPVPASDADSAHSAHSAHSADGALDSDTRAVAE